MMEQPVTDINADLKVTAEKGREFVSTVAHLLEEVKKLRVTNHGLTFERDGLMVSNSKLSEDVDRLADVVRDQQELFEVLQQRIRALEEFVQRPTPDGLAGLQTSYAETQRQQGATFRDVREEWQHLPPQVQESAQLAPVTPPETPVHPAGKDDVWREVPHNEFAPIRGRLPSFPPPIPPAPFMNGPRVSVAPVEDALC